MSKRFNTLSTTTILLVTTALSQPLFAMSQQADTEQAYQPRDWQQSTSPADDAHYALQHEDSRLLGFALRATVIPGVESNKVSQAQHACGVRLFEGMGDVIKLPDDLKKRQAARAYALEYNQVIRQNCLP